MATTTESLKASTLKFQPFSSVVDVSFWHELTNLKLDKLKLTEQSLNLQSYFSFSSTSPPFQYFSRESFSNLTFNKNNFLGSGILLNKNTIEGFKELDKQQFLQDFAPELLKNIDSGEALENPSILNKFAILSFSDLKKYKFIYWFAFPALALEPTITATGPFPPSNFFTSEQITSINNGYNQLLEKHDQRLAAFLIKKINEQSCVVELISSFESLYSDGTQPIVMFIDPSPLESNYPGWPARNLLALFARKFKCQNLLLYCYRDKLNTNEIKSKVFNVNLPNISGIEKFNVVGWEVNQNSKLLPRSIDLAASMDPQKLAASSVDLNLKLMRWRLLPEIQLEMIANTKCLLFGAGTLGCNVSRCLLGWGIRNITLIDNGYVSYSNPVRQSLFEYNDCFEQPNTVSNSTCPKNATGAKSKAVCAAQHLKQIFPMVNANGYHISIPMPGHTISESMISSFRKDLEFLDNLVQQHDVIYLLTDSREARWLGTLLANVYGKLCINAALGFDTYLVMRHGTPNSNDQLGCYFCSDVVAPQNSSIDRTLDQQCTVTRPGGSYIAAATAVELMISVLHHPLKACAPADLPRSIHESTYPLGLVPHQIRGYLLHFTNLILHGHAFSSCTGCSNKVLNEYKTRNFEFILQVCNQPTFLEDLTGITELKNDATSADWTIENADSNEDDF
eukprot:TRINITY_DN7494_c1_g2_i1.p1 TRINITY_DN7494_c1_g2~~TRINITY_DN7494_c1_g2_i1.p1  ORF type:complete len:695 (-),score=260.03 TRINITY_DN7494_c1_g2_i1:76-2112(-)